MDGQEFANLLIAELEKKSQRRIKPAITWESLREFIQDALDPKALTQADTFIPSYVPAVIPPEFPKLKVKYGSEIPILAGVQKPEKTKLLLSTPRNVTAQSWIIVHSADEEDPYRSNGWLSRPMKELEILKTDGIPEHIPDKRRFMPNGERMIGNV